MENSKHETSPATPTNRDELRRSFASVFEAINAFPAEEDEEKREERCSQLDPLCVMRRIQYTIQLAWGGPEYGFKLSYDPEAREWVSGLFYWAHWFAYEEQPLSAAELDQVVAAYALDGLVE